MIVAILGESCTGKSTLCDLLKERLNAEVYTGKDYLRLAKNEDQAKKLFMDLLRTAEHTLIYVISEKSQLSLLPEHAFKIGMSADLSIIEERFAKRMNNHLPAPVKAMLERKHGCFDDISCNVRIHNSVYDVEALIHQIQACKIKKTV